MVTKYKNELYAITTRHVPGSHAGNEIYYTCILKKGPRSWRGGGGVWPQMKIPTVLVSLTGLRNPAGEYDVQIAESYIPEDLVFKTS